MSLKSILTIKSHSFVVFAFMFNDLLWRLGYYYCCWQGV